jgi:hypothetical protein
MWKRAAVTLFAASCGSSTHDAQDARGDAQVGTAITCDPTDDWVALEASTAGDANLADLGDAVVVTPEEAGDGNYHMFVGVYHPEIISNGHGVAVIHEAISSDPHQPFTLSATPTVPTFDSYDVNGIETPTYVRADAHTEYMYYCAIYYRMVVGSTVNEKGKVAGLRRVDGGAWQKLGPVAPFSSGETSQCEGEALLDPATHQFALYYITDAAPGGAFVRTTTDPTLFSDTTATYVTQAWSRMGISYDPFASTWRFALDDGGYVPPYPVQHLKQTWAASPIPGAATLTANEGPLHEPLESLHPTMHQNAAGTVFQNARAIYPSADEVIFFYTGIGTSNHMHVIAQRCRRA